MRRALRAASGLDEGIKWRNLVYFSSGPVLDQFVSAQGVGGERVQFGFRLQRGMDGRATREPLRVDMSHPLGRRESAP